MDIYNKYEKQSINRFLFLKDNQIETMKNNHIDTLGELSNISRKELKNIGIELQSIDEIDYELQRLGMGLRS